MECPTASNKRDFLLLCFGSSLNITNCCSSADGTSLVGHSSSLKFGLCKVNLKKEEYCCSTVQSPVC